MLICVGGNNFYYKLIHLYLKNYAQLNINFATVYHYPTVREGNSLMSDFYK